MVPCRSQERKGGTVEDWRRNVAGPEIPSTVQHSTEKSLQRHRGEGRERLIRERKDLIYKIGSRRIKNKTASGRSCLPNRKRDLRKGRDRKGETRGGQQKGPIAVSCRAEYCKKGEGRRWLREKSSKKKKPVYGAGRYYSASPRLPTDPFDREREFTHRRAMIK